MGTHTLPISSVVVTWDVHLLRETKEKLETTRENLCVTVRKMLAGTGVEHSTVWEELESLGYWEVCAWWVSHLLMEEHKLKWKKKISSQLMKVYLVKGYDFFHGIMIGDEKWFVPLIQKQSDRTWIGITQRSPRREAIKIPSAHRTMVTFFWIGEGCIMSLVVATWGNYQCYLLASDTQNLHPLLDIQGRELFCNTPLYLHTACNSEELQRAFPSHFTIQIYLPEFIICLVL